MNEKDRQKIDISCDIIANRVDMNILWPKLLENRIYNFDDCNIPSWKQNLDSYETKKNIISSIKTRGPYAFQNFLLSLEQSGYSDLATNVKAFPEIISNARPQEIISQVNDLSLSDSSESESDDTNDVNVKVSESIAGFVFENQPLKIVVKKSKSFRDKPETGKNDILRYVMRSKPRGLVLIICITEYTYLDRRESAVHDRVNLQTLFEEMGFEVTVTPDRVDGEELRKILREFAQKKDFHKVHSCFVIFSCHGYQAGKNWDAIIATSDYHPNYIPSYGVIYCSEIVEYFSSANCELLKGKPKVFIFQLCRGEKHQNAVPRFSAVSSVGPVLDNSNETTENNKETSSDNNYEDSLMVHTTTDGSLAVKPNDQNDPTKDNKIHQSDRNYEDTLVVHATVPGFLSYRDKITGAWLIQIICKVFMKEAHHKHLCELFKRVDAHIQKLRTEYGTCQTLVVTNMGFNQDCFLHPGYFGDGK